MAGKRGEGERLDELLRRLGHDDMYVEGLSLQCADKFRSFIGRDSAGDSYGDLHIEIVRPRECAS